MITSESACVLDEKLVGMFEEKIVAHQVQQVSLVLCRLFLLELDVRLLGKKSKKRRNEKEKEIEIEKEKEKEKTFTTHILPLSAKTKERKKEEQKVSE